MAGFSLSAATLYVSLDSPNPSPPFATWAMAATNIQHAVDVASSGDEIVVTNGVYRLGAVVDEPNRVVLTNRVVVRSINGPEVTVIEGAAPDLETGERFGARCAYVGEGSVLSGFTLTKGTAYWSDGGGVYCQPFGVVTNCLITGNSSVWGGGASGGTLYNCTVTANSASGAVGGVVGESEVGWCTLYDCIVCFNQGGNWLGELTAFSFSCTSPLPPGPGNIAADPQLASLTHLSPTSPCVGAGSAAYASGVDIDGERWANPPAMGADQPGPTTGPLTVGVASDFTHVGSGYPVAFTAWNSGPILRSVWDFGDGTTLTNQPVASHAWSAPGVYTVRLTGYNDSHPEGVSAALEVTVRGPACVDLASANPVFPYTSWGTAATNIQDGVRAGSELQAGACVLVTNGVYRLGTTAANGLNRVALTNRITVRSVNGPELTVIEGENTYDPETGEGEAVWCAYVGDGSVLSGFTFRNGMAIGSWPAGLGGGVYAESRSGVVTNCVITGNSAEGGGGAYGAMLYNCTLSGNSAGDGGGAYDCALLNCRLTGNSAKRAGGGVFGGGLFCCTLTGNAAQEIGGGAYSWRKAVAHLNSCIIYFNQAPEGPNYASAGEGEPYDCSFWHSCTTPLPTNSFSTNNIDADPCFVDAAAGDFRLRPDSPCIDAGTNLTEFITTDMLGLPRPLDGNGDGLARVDMGAYEFNPYRFGPVLRPDPNGFNFTVQGEPGKSVRIERSRDLLTWEVVATVPLPVSGQTLIDPVATLEPFLFYRAVSVP
jgi:PKD repeat protein